MNDYESVRLSAAKWQSRLTRARSLLDDPRAICGIQARIESLRRMSSPSASTLEGERQLRAARKVGFLPGSFNPLTNAHIALAEAARRVAGLDVVIWGISTSTVDKETVERASLVDRLAQLVAYARATHGNAVVALNQGLYVDEADAMRACMPPGAALSIIIGYDKMVQILDPHYYEDRDAALDRLFDAATILVGPREGYGRAELDALLAQPSNARYRSYVTFTPLEGRYATDSSTEVRQLATGDLGSDRIRSLVVPEGFALLELRPYQASEETTASHDIYMARTRWVQLLGQIPDRQCAGLPSLTHLARGILTDGSSNWHSQFWDREDVLTVSEIWDLIRHAAGEASGSDS